MGRVTTVITGDASQLTAEQRKVVEGAAAMKNEYRDVGRQAQAFGREADKVFKETRSEQERYNQRLERLNALLKSNKIDQETYNRAVERLNHEYRESNNQLGSLGASLSRYLSTAAGLTLVRDMWQGIREEREKIAQLETAKAPSTGLLMQVADPNDPAADYKRLRETSLKLMEFGAATSLEDAQRMMFALRSTDQESDLKLFANLARTQLIPNITDVINAADSLKDAFGRDETGTAAQIVAKGLAVGGLSQKPVNEILAATSKAGAGVGMRKLSDEETMAAVGVLADPFARIDTAADRVKAFMRQADSRLIEGKKLFEIIDNVDAMIDESGKTPFDILGAGEAVEFMFFAKKNRDAIEKATRLAEAANDTTSLDERMSLLEEFEAEDITRREQAGKLDAAKLRRGSGKDELLRKSIIDASERLDVLTGASENAAGAVSRFARSRMEYFGADPINEAHVPGLIRAAEAAGQDEVVAVLREIADMQRRRNELDERRERENSPGNRRPSPRVPTPETN